MKRQQRKNVQARTRDPLSQSSLKEYNSDIEDTGQDSDSGCGYDERKNMDSSSDPIEGISDDDDFYNDLATTNNNKATIHSPGGIYFDDIQPFTDDDDDDDDNHRSNRPTPRKKFKPFKALEGLEQWRPDSSELLEAATRNTNTNSDNDNDSIEEIYNSDMDMDTEKLMNDNSLDSISTVSPTLSPTTAITATAKHKFMNYNSGSDNTSRTAASAPLPSFSHPSLSLYQAKTQDTPKNSHIVKKPAFILDHTNNHVTNKPQLPIKKDGLASMALNCINQELCKYREWQSSVLAEMAKHGSVSKVCLQDRQGRLCRILEMWVEHDMIFSWCVDLTIKERQQLMATKKKSLSSHQRHYADDDDDDDIQQQDSDTDASQPPPPLPTYESNDDDRPYVCVFATTYLHGPRKNIISKLMKAQYIAIWAPWTTVPISVDGADLYVHIVTRFMMDDSRGG